MKRRRCVRGVVPTEQVLQLRFRSARVTHALMPPHEPGSYTSTSHPFSVGISFTGHARAVIESRSRGLIEQSFGPGTIGITGREEIQWLRVSEPSESLMVYPAVEELMRVPRPVRASWQQYSGFMQGRVDPVIWSICARFRMAALGTAAISDLEAESLVDALLTRVATCHLGARPLPWVNGRLDARRIARVTDLVESRLHDPPSLHELAAATALSRFHFHRVFRATTGLSPHEYVTARRMERARRLLAQPDATVAQVAATLGFSDLAQFRRSFRRHFNGPPRGRRQ